MVTKVVGAVPEYQSSSHPGKEARYNTLICRGRGLTFGRHLRPLLDLTQGKVLRGQSRMTYIGRGIAVRSWPHS